MSMIEAILEAVRDSLSARGLNVARNIAVPVEVPAGGMVILRDGDPEEPERVLGGFESSYCRHNAEIEVLVQSGSDAARDSAFDTLVSSVQAAVYADKTFGGLAHGFESARPSVVTIPVEGGPAIKAGTIILSVEYTAANPLE